jgi:hypothetical protein
MSGVCLQDYRGLRAKTRDDGLFSKKPRVSLAKRLCEGVSDLLSRQIHDQRPRLDPNASARGERWQVGSGGWGTDTRGPRVSGMPMARGAVATRSQIDGSSSTNRANRYLRI